MEEEIIEALDPIPVERIAEAVERIAEAAETFNRAGLNRRALVQLIRLAAPQAIKISEIGTVLDALPRLTELLTEELA